MHDEETMNAIAEAARSAANAVMDVGQASDTCPPCTMIMTMAFIMKILTSPDGPLGEKALDPDYVIYAMLDDYYGLTVEAEGKAINDTRKMH